MSQQKAGFVCCPNAFPRLITKAKQKHRHEGPPSMHRLRGPKQDMDGSQAPSDPSRPAEETKPRRRAKMLSAPACAACAACPV